MAFLGKKPFLEWLKEGEKETFDVEYRDSNRKKY
jgi:hypothetical protein